MKAQDRTSRKIIWQGVVLLLLIFLAISRWLPGSDPLTPETSSRGVLQIVLLVFAVILAFLFYRVNGILAGFKLPTYIILIVFCLWAAISAIWAPSAVLAVGKALSLLMIVLIVAALANHLKLNAVSSERVIFPALIFFIAFLLIDNWLTYGNLFQMTEILNRQRLLLGHNHPNESAIYLASALFFCVVAIWQSRRTKRLFLILLALCLMVLLWRTDSRTSIIASFFTIFLFVVLKMPSARSGFLAALLGLMVTIVALLFIFMRMSVNGTLTENFRTVLGRFELWETSFSLLPSVNIGGNGYFSSRFYLIPSSGWASHTHNALVEMIFDVGIVGVIIFVAFFFSILPVFLQAKRFPVVISFLILSIIEGLTDVNLFFPTLIMTILCLLIFEWQFEKISISPVHNKQQKAEEI